MILIMKSMQKNKNVNPHNLNHSEISPLFDNKNCYICLEPTVEYMSCLCRSPVHFKCYYKFCEKSQSMGCSICKIEPLEMVHLKEIVHKDRMPIYYQPPPYEHSWIRAFISFFAMFMFFSVILSLDSNGKIVMLHPSAYILLALFTMPLSSMCSVKRRPYSERLRGDSDSDSDSEPESEVSYEHYVNGGVV